MIAAIVCALLLFAPEVSLQLADGRVLHGTAMRKAKGNVHLTTAFGEIVLPASALKQGKTSTPRKTPARRTRRTKWIELEHDLSDEREKLYADQLDAFFDLMVFVYDLDEERLRKRSPYGIKVYRRRRDFKKVQSEVAPGIEESKGKGFAEGVAGFYSGVHDAIFMWDAEGSHGGSDLGVAKHETTHMLNKRFGAQEAIKLPVWFEEGTATYFSTYVPVGDSVRVEPEPHPGALALVVGEIRQDRAMTSRELRATSYSAFLSRQYSWGWGLIHYFRNANGGKRWKDLLKYMRTLSSAGGVTDSEERRFLKTAGFKSSGRFDEAWHEYLLEAEKGKDRAPAGTSPEILERIEELEKPSPEVSRNFARVGASFARARLFEPAIVYLRAALRGGVEEAHLAYQLASCIAGAKNLPDDVAWPDEALRALEEAVRRAPLRALYRMQHGVQLLARADNDADLKRARDALGLALLLAGPDDDDVALAMALIGASVRLEPERDAERIVEGLVKKLPAAEEALRTSLVYQLQESEEWSKLAAIVERRMKKGTATFEERVMLAGLFKASDELEDAARLYAALLREKPDALGLWPDLVECLIGLDRLADAKAAIARARAALDNDPRDWGFIRRRLDKLAD